MRRGSETKSKIGRRVVLAALCGLVPAAMGGCPEFRNDTVTAVETAVRSILDAAVELYFDQFRTDDVG